MLTFNRIYFALTAAIFCIEILIALFVKDNFVRPYVGDVLVVILLYCFVRSFLHARAELLAAAVLLFAFTIEYLQYIHIVNKLGLEYSRLARIVIGTSFAWADILAYICGIGIVIAFEKYISSKQSNRKTVYRDGKF